MARKTKAEAELTRQQILDAALLVFHQRGVSRTTLDQIARAAGVTRGAVYWHFANKTELFFAMREQITLPLIDHMHELLLAEDLADPLDGVEQTVQDFFKSIMDCPQVRQLFDIVFLRCEYVDEFAEILAELLKPSLDFLRDVEIAYQRARDKGTLAPGLDPNAMALDTWAFVRGTFQHLLSFPDERDWPRRIGSMVQQHMALRRKR
ncbi:MAG: TetR family transcriptional regulator [Pseudomonadota bacterium]